jgi:predicted ATP-dependent endonuclease of OLD family
MIKKIKIENFKLFESVEIELDNPVVFVGPNNSGKTTALQALSLWFIGYKLWKERYLNENKKSIAVKRSGIAINRLALINVPTSSIKDLFKCKKTHKAVKENGKNKTDIIHIKLTLEGDDKDGWTTGFDFYYNDTESLYCKLNTNPSDIQKIPDNLLFSFLSPQQYASIP